MAASLQPEPFLTLEEYRALEESSPIRHEYLDGYVQAMAGGGGPHHVITSNLMSRLGAQLHGKPCFPYGSDRRLIFQKPGEAWGYYPDVTVDCTGISAAETTEPTIIFEVLSETTRRVDFVEKKRLYCAMPSMRVYVLVEQTRPLLTIFRRAEDSRWEKDVLAGLKPTLELPEIGCKLPLSHIYERVEFTG